MIDGELDVYRYVSVNTKEAVRESMSPLERQSSLRTNYVHVLRETRIFAFGVKCPLIYVGSGGWGVWKENMSPGTPCAGSTRSRDFDLSLTISTMDTSLL